MQKITAQSPESQSADLIAENVERLKELFPEAFTEGKVDFDVLRQLLGGAVDEREERYGLNWNGKRKARQLALTPSTGTLRPCPQESENWDTTQNLMIEGDNLEVLKLLQKSYAGKVKLIYIDPPYNTGKDFVYPDRFQDNIKNYLELTGQIEGGQKISSNTESSGRFHTDWLNMMYPRLKLARELLSPTGVMVVHIDEHEVEALALVLREIFGEENELGVLIWDKRNPKGDSRGLAYQHESIVLFSRDFDVLSDKIPVQQTKANAQDMLDTARRLMENASTLEEARRSYRAWVKSRDTLSGGEAMYDRLTDNGRVYRLVSMSWPNKKQAPEDYFIPLKHPVTGKNCPVPERGWRNPPATMRNLLDLGLIEFGPDESTQPQRIYYLDENMTENVPSIVRFGGSDDALLRDIGIPFEHPKPYEFAASVISWCVQTDDIVLDFFAGSGTTGHAVMAQNAADGGNRRYILVQLPEPLDPSNKDQKVAAAFCDTIGKPRNIAELTKERLRRAGAKIKDENPMFSGDVGFRVFKLDTSNIRAWDPDRDDLSNSLLNSTEHLKTDRSEQDVLFELLLKLGLDLTVPIESRTIGGKAVHSIGAGTLFACLSPRIARDEVEPLALGIVAWHQELSPAGETQVVFRDSAFADDVAKTNCAAILQQNGIENVRSL